MLSEGQHGLVQVFGLLTGREADKFVNVKHDLSKRGLPVIPDTCGWIECICLKEIDDGDRSVILAEAVDGILSPDRKPLRKSEMMKMVSPVIREKLELKSINDGIRDSKLIKKFKKHIL